MRAAGADVSYVSRIDAMVQHADTLRSAKSDEFASALKQLKAVRSSTNPGQRDAIAYFGA